MVELILKKDVVGLGEEGDIVRVRDGYARNYLLPLKYAVLKTENNLRILEKQKEAIQKRREEKRKANQSLKAKIEETKVELYRRVVEGNKLYGSVSARDLMEILAQQGIQIAKQNIEMPGPLKLLGEYAITVRLSTEEKAVLKVVIRPQE